MSHKKSLNKRLAEAKGREGNKAQDIASTNGNGSSKSKKSK